MKNKKALIFVVAIFILAFVGCAVITWYKGSSTSFDPKIFSAISDFEFLREYETGTAPAHDKYLDGKTPLESYVSLVEYDGKTYSVYAYVLNSADDAYLYFKNASGQHDEEQYGCDVYCISSYSGSRFWAYNENCVYRVEGGAYAPFAQFMTFLTKDFSHNLLDLMKEDRKARYEESNALTE